MLSRMTNMSVPAGTDAPRRIARTGFKDIERTERELRFLLIEDDVDWTAVHDLAEHASEILAQTLQVSREAMAGRGRL